MKTAVLTFFYKAVEIYLEDFISSLQNQTNHNFELIIVNDGADNIEGFLNSITIHYRVLHFSGSFISIRKQAIYWLAENGFETVVFADSDDWFDSRRIEQSIKLLRDYELVCNELLLCGEKIYGFTPMLSARLTDGQIIDANHLYDGNIMGMTNTSAHLKTVCKIIGVVPDDIVAFDWLLFAKSLLTGASCCFTNQTYTFYRQHSNNIASPYNFTDEQIIRGVKVKTQHYDNLKNYGKKYISASLLFNRLLLKLESKEFRNLYCAAVRVNAPQQPLWWEAIKTDKELAL